MHSATLLPSERREQSNREVVKMIIYGPAGPKPIETANTKIKTEKCKADTNRPQSRENL